MSVRPTLDVIAIESAFKSLIKQETGLDTIWGGTNGVQPNRPYCEMSWLSMGTVGDAGSYESYNDTDNTVESNYYSSRVAEIDVQVWAESTRASGNAFAYIDRLMTVFDLNDTTQEWLDPVGVAVSDFTEVQFNDVVEDGSRKISRAAFTLRVNLAANATAAEIAGAIESVALTGTISGATGGSFTDDMVVTRD